MNKPIIDGDNVNFDNIFYLIKHIIKSYFRVTIFLLLLFFVYKFIQTPSYSSSISFYTNYEKSNQINSNIKNLYLDALIAPSALNESFYFEIY